MSIEIDELERSQLMDVLEQATAKLLSGDVEPNAEWTALVCGILDLPIAFVPAVQVVLSQGRWRNAKNPKAYIRKAARREWLKAGGARDPKSTLIIPRNVLDEDGQPISYEAHIDHQWYDGPVKQGSVWKSRNAMEEAIYADDEGRKIPEVNGRPVPEDLLMLQNDGPDARLVVNWAKVAERAGLDAEEAQILILRRVGVTREALLKQLSTDDVERRKWQAAWQRLHEHGDRVRAALAGIEKN